MRLTKIEFGGYKRLGSTSCNVDGRLIAILGPNEAGKSSVLEGLAWLTDEDEGPLPGRLRSRGLGRLADERPVVVAQYALDDDDRAVLSDLDTDVVPRYYRFLRLADGTRASSTMPALTRRPAAAQEAALAVLSVSQQSGGGLPSADDGRGPGDLLPVVLEALKDPDRPVDERTAAAFTEMVTWLRLQASEPDEDGSGHDDDLKNLRAADKLEAALAKLREPDVAAEARRRLGERRPDFLLFAERDRVLDSTYDLSDPALLADVPPALCNLLALAGTTFDELRTAQAGDDPSRAQTLLKRCNGRLAARMHPTWRQSQLSVNLDLDATLLRILVDELGEDGARTDIAERSDGLRTFIALLCFLADKETDDGCPPVLLIDEAETHLHYDAQADLLDVLLNHVKTSKVIYTTHSPGCLPPDLGTGIRLVSPDPGNPAASLLKADFWHAKPPGFSPLLFAMGAGAAAFSVCRRAVLAEGASDMILLPSLIRKATGLEELGYQVAPGLSTGTQDMSDADIAASVVYLADGDQQGDRYQAELLDRGVSPDRVHLLPAGQAIEDLLTQQSWLAAVTKLMTEAGHTGSAVSLRDLRRKGPIAKRLKDWGADNRHSVPGKNAVASHLVHDPDRIELTEVAAVFLRDLHEKFTAALAP